MLRNTLLNSASILIFSSSSSCYGQWRDHGGPGWFGPGMMGSEWWGFGGIFMIVFWGLSIIALIFLIRWLAGQGRPRAEQGTGRDPALEILRQRYAKGEIDKEEFEKKKDLTS
jgi:putative membrane protein